MPAIVENCALERRRDRRRHRLGIGAGQARRHAERREVDVRQVRSPAAGDSAAMPKSSSALISSVVITGRRMNGSATFTAGAAGSPRRAPAPSRSSPPHPARGAAGRRPRRARPRMQSRRDDHAAAAREVDLHRPHLRVILLVDDEDADRRSARPAPPDRARPARRRARRAASRRRRTAPARAPVGVLEARLQRDRAGGAIDAVVDEAEHALLRIARRRRPVARARRPSRRRTPPALPAAALRHREAHVDRRDLVDRRRARVSSGLTIAPRCTSSAAELAGDRRADPRVLEVQLGAVHRGFARAHAARVDALVRVRASSTTCFDATPSAKSFSWRALLVAARLGLGVAAREPGARLLERGLERAPDRS